MPALDIKLMTKDQDLSRAIGGRQILWLWRNLCPPGSVDRHSRPPDVFLPWQNAQAERLISSIRTECF
jgi:hypothetical protein